MRISHLREHDSITVDIGDEGGNRVAYVEAGTGEPMLLLHGSLADYRYWSPQLKELPLRRRVLAPSLPGYWPHVVSSQAGDGFSVEQHAVSVAAFIDQVVAQPVHLVGHSRGANVALAVTRLRPSLVRSLVLADPGGTLGLRPNEIRAHQPDRARTDAAELIRRGEIDAGLQKFIDTVSGQGMWSRLNSRRKQMARDNALTLVAQVQEPPPVLTHQSLGAVERPTLLLGGEYSPQPYREILQTLSEWITHASLRIIANASHAMNAENPAHFNAALSDFFACVEKSELDH